MGPDYGLVITTEGEKIVLEKPGKPYYTNDDGGRFWAVQHKGGLYLLAAHLLRSYNEFDESEPGSADVLPPSW